MGGGDAVAEGGDRWQRSQGRWNDAAEVSMENVEGSEDGEARREGMNDE